MSFFKTFVAKCPNDWEELFEIIQISEHRVGYLLRLRDLSILKFSCQVTSLLNHSFVVVLNNLRIQITQNSLLPSALILLVILVVKVPKILIRLDLEFAFRNGWILFVIDVKILLLVMDILHLSRQVG